MKQFFIVIAISIFLVNCKAKKTSLKDEDAVEIADFIEFFPQVPLPVRVADSTLFKKSVDSLQIGYKIFTRFIPDSVLSKDFGKGVLPKIYPIGRAREKGKEIYLFIKAVNGAKKVAYMACFSKEEKFLNAMVLDKAGFDNYTNSYGMLDNKFQITTYREKKNGTSVQFKRNVYVFNEAVNEFMLIMTEPNEEIIEQVINPIDTLPQKNKFTGDYMKDRRNFISLRDTRNTNEFLFFIHFEKDNGDCIGELKGTMKMVSKNMSQYQVAGNPCAIEFTLDSDRITIKETGGCGSHRNIKCFFEGSFPKKRVVRAQMPAKKK